jgi:3'-5' exoribonuclease
MQSQTIRFSDLEVGNRVSGVVLASSCDVGQTKNGSHYLRLELRDQDASLISARMWDTGAEAAPDCPVAVEIDGVVEDFRGDLQIRVMRIEATSHDISPFVPTTYRPIEDLTDELTGLIELIDDESLRNLVNTCLANRPEFWSAPAAIAFHGAYRGGLLEHTLNVTRLCLHAADVYAGRVNQDLLLAASVLHDIGKADAYETPEKREPLEHERLVGHIVRGVMFVQKTAVEVGYRGTIPLNDLLHTLLSHHGELQFGAPIEPCIAEAMILSNADRMEADVTGCFDHWRDRPGSETWSYFRQRQRWIRRPAEPVAADIDVTDDLPF